MRPKTYGRTAATGRQRQRSDGRRAPTALDSQRRCSWPDSRIFSGHGALGFGWHRVRDALPGDVRSVWIDRAGLGWSKDAAAPSDPQTQVANLRAALQSAGVAPPYVVTGHSLGGAFAMLYAKQFPDDLSGLVLVSPTTPSLWDRLSASKIDEVRRWVKLSAVFPIAARLGLLHIYNPADQMFADLAQQEAQWAKQFARSPAHLRATAREAELVLPEGALMQQLRDWRPPRGVAVSLLYETDPADEVNAARAAYAADWKAALGNQIDIVRVDGANHVNMITKPDYAATVAAAIKRVAMKQ
jgi:pimeloyl-ACP methyl ester carboxylesterase